MIYSAVARMARLAILLLPATPAPSLAAEAPPQRPYSCRLYDEAQKKCAANSFGPCYVQRDVDRLRKECLRDGGRP